MKAGGALDLVETEIIGSKRRPSAIVAARVMKRRVSLELARPREDVGLIDPVFDDPPELGVTRAPAALLSHMGKSKWGPLPCPPEGEGNLGPHPTLPRERGREISA